MLYQSVKPMNPSMRAGMEVFHWLTLVSELNVAFVAIAPVFGSHLIKGLSVPFRLVTFSQGINICCWYGRKQKGIVPRLAVLLVDVP